MAKLKSAIERDTAVNENFDPKITVQKGAKGLAEGALAVVLTALIAYFTDAAAVTEALTKAGLREAVISVAVPVIVGLVRMAANMRKHA